MQKYYLANFSIIATAEDAKRHAHYRIRTDDLVISLEKVF